MPTQTRRQLSTALLQFYHQPVAKVSLELFLTLGSVIFFALFAIRPTLLTMSDLIKQIDEKKALSSQMDKKIAALSSVQTEYLQLQSQFRLLNEAIPSSPQLIYSLKVIEKLANEQGLLITGINVPEVPPEIDPEKSTDGPLVAQPKRVDLPVSIKIKGEYPAIRQFVTLLQGYRRTMVVDTIVFSIEEEQGSRSLEAAMTVSLPYFDANSSATSTKK